MTNRGRPAEYRNAAEKQKAYRERKKVDDQQIELALALLADIEAQESALRNSIEYHVNRGHEIEIYVSDFGGSAGHAKWSARPYVTNGINIFLARHMIRTGALIEVRRDWTGTYYTLANKKTG